jgi:hypothetical protein
MVTGTVVAATGHTMIATADESPSAQAGIRGMSAESRRRNGVLLGYGDRARSVSI